MSHNRSDIKSVDPGFPLLLLTFDAHVTRFIPLMVGGAEQREVTDDNNWYIILYLKLFSII